MTEQPSPESIFERALQCTDADELAIFMEEACGGNEDLRREVESLLAAHQAAGSFLKPQVTSKPNASSEGEGARIGRYVLREIIGEGSFGRVWLAEQVAPMRRLVALKILRLGLESSDLQGHFDAELQALAMMDHQCIATVYDGGTTGNGRPYFVMEYVRGVPITDFCDLRRFSLRQRIQLLCKVCQAVQHAHDKGIIHRDLKPSNILVKLQDDLAVPKVIDFGVAKALGQNLSEHDFFARYIQWAGTPTYMSPEQAGIHGKPHADVRSDVYSLGIILYELLTGRTPFDSHKLREAGPETILRAIREQDAPRASARFASLPPEDRFAVALYRREKPRTLRRVLEGELDRILGKALQRDRRMRYDSANALARDLDHYCKGGLISVDPPNLRTTGSWPYRKPAAVVAAVVTGLLIAVLGWSLSIRMGKNKRIEQYNALVAQADVEGVTEIPVDEKQLGILLEAVRGLRNTKRETIYQTLYLSKATDGTDIDQVIAGNATQQVMNSDIRKKLFKVLELRANPEVIPKLLEFATSSSNTGEVAAALEACKRMATDDHFGEFLRLLEAAGNGSIRHSAETTISEIIGRSNDRQQLAGQLLSAHRRQLNETTRHSLIRLLGHTGTDTAREKLMKSLGSEDTLEKQAAILAIGNWPDDSMFKVLIEFIWTTDDPRFRQRAFKTAYNHLRYKKRRRSTGEAGVLWKLLATVAKTEGEKKGVINSMPQIEGDWRIPLLKTFLNDESDRVRDDAERAIDYLGGTIEEEEPPKEDRN